MPNYITVADVDALLGSGWAGSGDAVQAVAMANAWLNAKITRQAPEPVPDEIKLAGAQVARDAAAGLLYQSREFGLLSKSVKAGEVSSSKTFSGDTHTITAGENYALALIKPWMRRQAVTMLKRI